MNEEDGVLVCADDYVDKHQQEIIRKAREHFKLGPKPNTHQIEKCLQKIKKGFSTFDMAVAVKTLGRLCEKCGQCCRVCDEIVLCDEDIDNLYERLGASAYEYIKSKGGLWYFKKAKPCAFLIGNKCSIYDARPLVCREYPFNKVGQDDTAPILCDKVSKNFLAMKLTALLIGELVKVEQPDLASLQEETAKTFSCPDNQPLEEQLRVAKDYRELATNGTNPRKTSTPGTPGESGEAYPGG